MTWGVGILRLYLLPLDGMLVFHHRVTYSLVRNSFQMSVIKIILINQSNYPGKSQRTHNLRTDENMEQILSVMYIQSCMHKLLPASLGKRASESPLVSVCCLWVFVANLISKGSFKVKTKQAQTITHCSHQAAGLQHSHKTSWDSALRAKKMHPNGLTDAVQGCI